ncbi:MAG: ATP-binding protein [Spirochaetales bacterium]|nr:ATP-binding protein [Spirochaetales bacterium]
MHGIVSKILKLTRLEHFLPSALDRTRGVDYLEKQNLSQSHPHIIKQIIIDDTHPLLQPDNMYYKKFNIDLSQARRLANLISQKSPVELREFNILEQQICEIIKNAVKHGNKNNPEKSIDVWFEFSESHARLIVQDEGSGFQDIEKWNEFYRNKISCYRSHDYEKMMDYLRFTTLSSDETDGGNAMCAAVEYWNEGVVYSASRNKVGVMRMFHSD